MGEAKNNLRQFKSQREPAEESWLVSGEMVLVSGVYRLDHKELGEFGRKGVTPS